MIVLQWLLGPIGRYLILAVALAGLWAGVRAHYVAVGRGQVQPALDQAVKDKDALAASLQAKERELVILNEVRADYDAKLQSLSTLSGDVRALARTVSLCNSVVAVPADLPGATGGTGEESGSDGTRPAADVLVELATDFATERDQLATRINALINWLERTRGE